MVEICEIQNIVDAIIGSVQLSQVHKEVQAMQLWDPTGTNRENLQWGDLLTKHPENISILENVSFSRSCSVIYRVENFVTDCRLLCYVTSL